MIVRLHSTETIRLRVVLTEVVCAPLYDAESIFASLQASPNAHLDKKIVSTGLSNQGWGDGLGWGHEVIPLLLFISTRLAVPC